MALDGATSGLTFTALQTVPLFAVQAVGAANLTLIAVRRLPPQRGFLVSAGLAEAPAFLEGFDFAEEDLGYLRDVGFDQSTLEAFARLRFTGDVWAVSEGRVVFPDEPLLWRPRRRSPRPNWWKPAC